MGMKLTLRKEETLAGKELHELHKVWGLTKTDFSQMVTAELLSLTGAVLAGAALALSIGRLDLIPALFIALPGFLEMRGSIGGSLSARLSSALFLGYLKPRIGRQHVLWGNILAAILLSIAGSLALGGVAYVAELLVFGIAFPQIIIILLLASVLSMAIEIPFTVATTFALFRRGVDPNNVMGPYITALGDIVSIASLLLVAVVIL